MKVEVVDQGQVVKHIKRVLARFIYLFGVADHRQVPLDVVKNRMTIKPAGRAKNVPPLKFGLSDTYHSNSAAKKRSRIRSALAWKLVRQKMNS